MKFLPIEKQRPTKSFFNRQDSSSRQLPPKLNSSALKQLNDQNQHQKSPFKYPPQNNNFGGLNFSNNLNAIKNNLSIVSTTSASKKVDSDAQENRPSIVSANRKSSMQRVKQGVMGMFSSKKSNAGDSYRNNDKDVASNNDKIQAIHFNERDKPPYPHSQAVENEKKGLQGIMTLGITSVINNLKKPAS